VALLADRVGVPKGTYTQRRLDIGATNYVVVDGEKVPIQVSSDTEFDVRGGLGALNVGDRVEVECEFVNGSRTALTVETEFLQPGPSRPAGRASCSVGKPGPGGAAGADRRPSAWGLNRAAGDGGGGAEKVGVRPRQCLTWGLDFLVKKRRRSHD
jgi:hypothetical protein